MKSSFFIFTFLSVILFFGCKTSNQDVTPDAQLVPIKGSLELPVDIPLSSISIVSGNQSVPLTIKGARIEAGITSGSYEINLPQNKVSIVAAVNNSNQEIICLSTYSPQSKLLEMNVKSLVNTIIKSHPLFMTQNPKYDLAFNKLIAESGGIEGIYQDVENQYKLKKPLFETGVGLVLLSDLIPTIANTKIASIWKKMEDDFIVKIGSFIPDYKDVSVEDFKYTDDKSTAIFTFKNPLNRLVAYSIKKGKWVDGKSVKIEDSITNWDFIEPNTDITWNLTKNWFWSVYSGEPLVLPVVTKDKTIDVKGYDYVDIKLYGLGRKQFKDGVLDDDDILLFSTVISKSVWDVGMSLIESWTNVSDLNTAFKKVYNGVGRDKQNPGVALLESFTTFMITEKKDFIKKYTSALSNGESINNIEFYKESSIIFIEFIKADKNFKWLTDFLQQQFGKEATKTSIQVMGKALTTINNLYYAYQTFQGTVLVSEKVAAIWDGNLIQTIPRIYINNPTYPVDGLIAYYPFNGDAKDASGNGNDGTVNGAALTSDRKGNANGAYSFGGINQPSHIVVKSSNSLNFNGQATYSLFVKVDNENGMDGWGGFAQYGNHCLFAKSHDRSGYALLMVSSPDGTSLGIGSFAGVKAFNTNMQSRLTKEKWVHVAIVFDGKTSKTYFDGSLVGTNNTESIDIGNNQDLYFGKFSDYWYPLNGCLDDIRIYNRALSDTEVLKLATEK